MVINTLSLMYIMYILSFVALPTIRPVTSTNMNYAGPIVLGIVVVALCDWTISGRKRFVLPEAPILR
jgi:choline transport protein